MENSPEILDTSYRMRHDGTIIVDLEHMSDGELASWRRYLEAYRDSINTDLSVVNGIIQARSGENIPAEGN